MDIVGIVTSLEVAVGDLNVIRLASGHSVSILLRYEEANPASATFSAVLNTGDTLDTSSVSINSSDKTIEYVIHSSFMSSLSFGGYSVNLTLAGDEGSTAVKEMVLMYEEEISNFTVYFC
jgi:hypothetical protein